jgi:imidazolonepropionase-like amidohydrolase
MPWRKDRFSLPLVPAAIWLLASLALAPESVRSGEPLVFAIANARIITVSGPSLDSGTVIIRKGIIESVGTGLPVPADARVVDARGLTLYPGFIDGLSDVGLEETSPPAAAPGRASAVAVPAQPSAIRANPSPDERQGLTPYMQAADLLNPTSLRIEAARAAGITMALIAPKSGFFRGQSSLINLAGSGVGDMVVKTPVFLHIGFAQTRAMAGGYPSSLMGTIAFIRQTLLDALNYEPAWSIYNSNPGVPRPEYSRALQSLVPAVKQQIAVVLPGDTPAQIQRALDLAEAFKLRMILSGGAEAGGMAQKLRDLNVPVLLSVRFPERERDIDPRVEEELSSLRRRVEAPSQAAALANSGVKFAFQSDAMDNPRDFIRNVGKTVEAGLDRAVALRSLTLTPAEIFGVAEKLGSIEKSKCANLVLATGDIFDPRTRVKMVFVDGRMFEIPEPEAPPAQVMAASGAAGTWTLRIDSPHGPLEVTLKLEQSGAELNGTLTSPFGTEKISNGAISGNNVTFKANINPSGGGGFIVMFNGTLQGNSMSGSADAGIMGKMDFTGSRSPNN